MKEAGRWWLFIACLFSRAGTDAFCQGYACVFPPLVFSILVGGGAEHAVTLHLVVHGTAANQSSRVPISVIAWGVVRPARKGSQARSHAVEQSAMTCREVKEACAYNATNTEPLRYI